MSDATPYSEGDPSSRICLIGEAPSTEEMRQSRPFVGPAGQLLDSCLHAAAVARRETYILNCFDEPVRKPRDDAAKILSQAGDLLWTSAKGFTAAGLEASAGCRARLASSTANVIVPLGGTALHLTHDVRKISQWRGSILVNAAGRKLVPTFHPSYCLQGSYESRFVVISDLQKAKAESLDPAFVPTPRALTVDPTFEQCIAFLRRCLTASEVNTDIEVLHGQVDCFSLATSPSEAICIPLIDAGYEHRWSESEELEIWRLYAKLLQSPHITKINQNIAFDLATLLQLNGIVPCGPLHDPMIAHSVMYPALKKSLALLCSLYTREPFYKDQGDLHDSHKVDDFARRWRYNALDAAISLECWRKLEPEIDPNGYRETYDMTIARIPALIYMMVRGIKVDRERLHAAKAEAERSLAAIIAKLEIAFGRRIITEAPKKAADKRAAAGALNVNSPAQLMAYFYGEKKLRPYLSSAGVPTIDDKALVRIVRRDGLPEAKLVQEYRKVAKLLGTYFEMRFDGDERMRCSYNPRGTWTGRLSSSQTVFGNGGNLQNLPDSFAGFLVADKTPQDASRGETCPDS